MYVNKAVQKPMTGIAGAAGQDGGVLAALSKEPRTGTAGSDGHLPSFKTAGQAAEHL